MGLDSPGSGQAGATHRRRLFALWWLGGPLIARTGPR